MNTKLNHQLDFSIDTDFNKILTNPILDIAARFWDENRYQAFRICYHSMRKIDDLVDEHKTMKQPINQKEAQQIKLGIFNWLDSVRRRESLDTFQKQFVETLDKFNIPFWPWERLGYAMVYDLDHNGFPSFLEFLRYAEGAAVAPASVFMHLCGLHTETNRYSLPDYNIRKAARPLALFSYLVHIIRDFNKDTRANLTYFATDLIQERGLTNDELRAIAEGKPACSAFRDLIATYIRFARYYEKKAIETFDTVLPQLEYRYQLSLLLIHALYLQILERVNVESDNFTLETVNPPRKEIQKQIERTIMTFKPAH